MTIDIRDDPQETEVKKWDLESHTNLILVRYNHSVKSGLHKENITLATVVDILTFVALHHGDGVAAVLLIEPASSRSHAVSAHAVVREFIVSVEL